MRVAIDYDKTWTADPEVFALFAKSLTQRGHDVRMVTMRHETEPVDGVSIPVHYTARRAKAPYMQALGLPVDVWIDDSPHWVNSDSF